MQEEKARWYEKKEYYGLAALVVGGVKYFTQPHTIVHQLADYLITIGLPLTMGYMGVKDAKKFGTPSGISKAVSGINSLFKKN